MRPQQLATRELTGMGTAFGTFGELLQGVLPEKDGDFLVTLPVARWSRATFRPGPEPGDTGDSGDSRHADDSPQTGLTVRPAHKHKALQLARMIAEETSRPASGALAISSMIPEGKGLASSSADLVATARAVGHALRTPMPPTRIERLLAHIEPTDGVLYPAVVAFHHRAVRLRSVLGPLSPMAILGVDEGGHVDTVDFNRLPKPFTAADHRTYARLLERLTRAVRDRDLAEVGRVATHSARMNQDLRHKKLLDPMLNICEEVGGLGVAVAHSGTTLGILLDTADPTYPYRAAAAAEACTALAGAVSVYRTLSFPSSEREFDSRHPLQ